MALVDRRKFLKMAAAGSAVAAAATALPIGILTWANPNTLKFRAVIGMPKAPLPPYASFVISGSVDLGQGTGTVRKSLYFGAPEAMSNILFPGTERLIRVTAVRRSGDTVQISGMVNGGQKLGPRESPNVLIAIDRRKGLAQADFLGRQMVLKVQ
jgi:hypothetical protein